MTGERSNPRLDGNPQRGSAAGASLLVLRVALGGLFIFAAFVKLLGPADFADSVKAFKILPDHLNQLAVFAVPWTELICGLAMVLGWWTHAAAGLASLTLAVFIGGIASVLWRDLTVNCGCFGKLQPFCTGPLGTCHIVQDSIMLTAGVLVMFGGGGLLSVDRCLMVGRSPQDPPLDRTSVRT